MLGGESLIVRYVDDVGRAHVGHALPGVVEAVFEQPEIFGAGWDEGAVTNDADVIVAEGVCNAS